MAKFELEHTEGMRWIKVTLNGETVRAERGALNHMLGNITMDTPLPSLRAILISFLSEESLLRPYYKGTGELYLESSLGGFHTFELNEGETWVLQNGAYWASEEGIELSLHRERFLTAFFAGEGLLLVSDQALRQGEGCPDRPGTGRRGDPEQRAARGRWQLCHRPDRRHFVHDPQADAISPRLLPLGREVFACL